MIVDARPAIDLKLNKDVFFPGRGAPENPGSGLIVRRRSDTISVSEHAPAGSYRCE